MRTVNLDALREKVGEEPCSDCGEPSETIMVNDRTLAAGTVYVCLACWSERHRKRAQELKENREKAGSAKRRFLDRIAAAKRAHGRDEWADAHDEAVASR